MDKITRQFKTPGSWALLLSFIAVTAVEISYILGGLNWLDTLLALLVPAFILLVIQIILTFKTETKNYCVAFTILVACLVFCFFRLSDFEFGVVGDIYHLWKIVAASIKNDFSTQQRIISSGLYLYLSTFIESIWGIFWRWTQWDFVIVLLQALPLILLWQELVKFFKKQNIFDFPGPLATVVIMTLEILWCQQSSPYIDSTAGILIGLTLLLSYSYLTPPYERRFSYLAGLVFISSLCLISKLTGIGVALLGLTVAFVLGFRYLITLEKILLPLILLPSLIYIISLQWHALITMGNFFYPLVDLKGSANFCYSFPEYYQILAGYSWIRDHAFGFKPLYIISRWLSDYGVDHFTSPAPYYRGNGLVFTYFVIPTLILWLFNHINIFKTKVYKDPRLSIFAVIFVFYYFFPGSIDPRFALGYNIFILAWCLSYLWQWMEQWQRFYWLKPLPTVIICLMLAMSTANYLHGIRGSMFQRRVLSSLLIQEKIFPQQVTPEIRASIIQKLIQAHAVQ